MPGLLHYTVHQGYDYLSPYVEKAQPYVEKARNNVPLIDPALKTAEELVPALITRADQLAEPQIEKMRPFVEPRIEQVKERVAPYVDEGVKQYGVLREGGVKYYHVGLEKVEQVKGFKDAKENQIRKFAEPRVEKIKEFTDPKVEKIKEFTQAQTTQIREFTNPKVGKIKELIEPKVAVITVRQRKIQQLCRVPASLDLQGLEYETLLGKVASWMEKMEALLDKYMPLTEEQKKDNESEISNVSDTSCVRLNRSIISIITRPLSMFTVKIVQLSNFSLQFKASYMDRAKMAVKAEAVTGWFKAKVAATKTKMAVKAEPILMKVNKKLAPKVAALTQTSLFKKVAQMAVSSSEKTLGKEKTLTILNRVEIYIPAEWKGTLPTPPVAVAITKDE